VFFPVCSFLSFAFPFLMRRLLRLRLPVLPAMRGFMELPYRIPSGPIDDVLLMDVDWSNITAHFPARRIHADVAAGEAPEFVLSESLRALALLPVLRSLPDENEEKAVWAPSSWTRGHRRRTSTARRPRFSS
jgi:hypothetical protein